MLLSPTDDPHERERGRRGARRFVDARLAAELPATSAKLAAHRGGSDDASHDPSAPVAGETLAAAGRAVAEATGDVASAVADKAAAVAEVGRRAAALPGDLRDEARAEVQAWARTAKRVGLAAGALAVSSLFALALVTVSLVSRLNAQWGDPFGTLAVAAAYAAAAVVAALVARAAWTRGMRDARAHVAHAKADARAVTRPLRRA